MNLVVEKVTLNVHEYVRSCMAHSRIEGLFVFHKGPIQKIFKVKVFIP